MGNLLNMLLMCAGQVQQQVDADGNPVQQGSSWWVIVVYIVIFGAFIYFIMIRPQRKQKRQQEDTMNAMQPGDSVLTTSGFYGTIVAINGDTVIVEFGNNKNCRIPMAKQAISQVEKAGAAAANATSADAAPTKKFFGRKKTEDQATESTSSESTSGESSQESSNNAEK